MNPQLQDKNSNLISVSKASAVTLPNDSYVLDICPRGEYAAVVKSSRYRRDDESDGCTLVPFDAIMGKSSAAGRDETQLHRWPMAGCTVTFAISPCGTRAIIGPTASSHCGVLQGMVSLVTKRTMAVFKEEIKAAVWSPDGGRLLVTAHVGGMCVYDPNSFVFASCKLLARIEDPKENSFDLYGRSGVRRETSQIHTMRFSPDGSKLAASFGESGAFVFDMSVPSTPTMLYNLPSAGGVMGCRHLDWSHDGAFLVSSVDGSGFQVFDTKSTPVDCSNASDARRAMFNAISGPNEIFGVLFVPLGAAQTSSSKNTAMKHLVCAGYMDGTISIFAFDHDFNLLNKLSFNSPETWNNKIYFVNGQNEIFVGQSKIQSFRISVD